MFSSSAPTAGAAPAIRSLPLESRGQFTYAVALALGLQPSTQYSPFKDLQNDHLIGPWITAAAEAHWASGYPDGTFRPDTPLTRAMAAKIEVNALGDGAAAAALASQRSPFRDDAAIPSWARGYINEAYKLGIYRGLANGYFQPEQSLTTFQTGHAILQLDAYLAQRAKKPQASAVNSAQFIEELTVLLGDAPTVLYEGGPMQPASLPPLSEAMAYYQSAENSGWLFPLPIDPARPITRAQAIAMTVLARGGVATDAQQQLAAALAGRPTPFSDGAAISSALRGYVNEALLLGMLPWRSGKLAPNADLTPSDALGLLDLAAQREMAAWTARPVQVGAPVYLGTDTLPKTLVYDGSSVPDGAGTISFGVFDAHGQALQSGTVQVQVANPSIVGVIGNDCSPKVIGTWCVPVGQQFTLISGTSNKTGTTAVTLRDGSASATFDVTAVRTPLSIDLTPQSISLYPGQKTQFRVLGVLDANGTPVHVKATLSASAGTLAADGTYTAGSALGLSQVTATATFNGQTYEATSQVLTLSHAAKLIVTLTDAKTGGAQVTAGDPVKGDVKVETASGSLVTSQDPLWLRLPGKADEQIGIHGGQASFEFMPAAAGAATATVLDTAAGALYHPLTQTASIEVVGAPATGYGLFDGSGQQITFDHPASLQTGVPAALTLKPVDAYGNPTVVSSATPVTVELLSSDRTGGFPTSPAGSPVMTVALQPGSSGVPVWYESNAAGVTSAVLSAAVGAHLVALVPTKSISSWQGTAGGTFEVLDANGRPVPWAPVAITLGTMLGSDEASPADEGGTGLASLPGVPMTGVTGADGSVGFLLQMPQGADGDADFSQTVQATIPGLQGTIATITLTW